MGDLIDMLYGTGDLKLEVKNLGKQTKELNGQVEEIYKKLTHSPTIVVFFRNREEFHNKVLNYLNKNNLCGEGYGGGIIMISETAVEGFRKEGFNFVTAKDMKELYAKYNEDIKNYVQQVKEAYNLPLE